MTVEDTLLAYFRKTRSIYDLFVSNTTAQEEFSARSLGTLYMSNDWQSLIDPDMTFDWEEVDGNKAKFIVVDCFGTYIVILHINRETGQAITKTVDLSESCPFITSSILIEEDFPDIKFPCIKRDNLLLILNTVYVGGVGPTAAKRRIEQAKEYLDFTFKPGEFNMNPNCEVYVKQILIPTKVEADAGIEIIFQK